MKKEKKKKPPAWLYDQWWTRWMDPIRERTPRIPNHFHTNLARQDQTPTTTTDQTLLKEWLEKNIHTAAFLAEEDEKIFLRAKFLMLSIFFQRTPVFFVFLPLSPYRDDHLSRSDWEVNPRKTSKRHVSTAAAAAEFRHKKGFQLLTRIRTSKGELRHFFASYLARVTEWNSLRCTQQGVKLESFRGSSFRAWSFFSEQLSITIMHFSINIPKRMYVYCNKTSEYRVFLSKCRTNTFV